VLARSGIEDFVLVDFDHFEESNINRQIFAYERTIGMKKTEVTEDFLKQINPRINAIKWDTVTEDNCDEMLSGCHAVILAIDNVSPCIIASRWARKHDVPLIEGWAIPFANVRVFTANTPSLEECYSFPSLPNPLGDISDDLNLELKNKMLKHMAAIEGLADFYDPEVIDQAFKGRLVSFAPMVWFTAVGMAYETIKVLLGIGKPALAPSFALYDPLSCKIPAYKGQE